jgi:hypothetical protein
VNSAVKINLERSRRACAWEYWVAAVGLETPHYLPGKTAGLDPSGANPVQPRKEPDPMRVRKLANMSEDPPAPPAEDKQTAEELHNFPWEELTEHAQIHILGQARYFLRQAKQTAEAPQRQ